MDCEDDVDYDEDDEDIEVEEEVEGKSVSDTSIGYLFYIQIIHDG